MNYFNLAAFVIISLFLLEGTIGVAEPEVPNVLVIKLGKAPDGGEPDVQVIPVVVKDKIVDEASAKAATLAANSVCKTLQNEAEAEYRRLARFLEPTELSRIRNQACLPLYTDSCVAQRNAAAKNYYRIARHPTLEDLELAKDAACSNSVNPDNQWNYQRQYKGYSVYGSGTRNYFGSGLENYFPNYKSYLDTHPNLDVPVFGTAYNGWGGPFSLSGYLYNRYDYTYLYYYNPLFWR